MSGLWSHVPGIYPVFWLHFYHAGTQLFASWQVRLFRTP
jgi:hypothetical protein